MPARKLCAPGAARPRNSGREAVGHAEIQVPAILVGFEALENRRLDTERAMRCTSRHDASCDVRAVEIVVGEWRCGIVNRGCPMHERGGAERDGANGRGTEPDAPAFADRP